MKITRISKIYKNNLKSIKRVNSKQVNLFALILVFLFMSFVGCSPNYNNTSNYKGPKVYLLNEENNSIEGINLDLKEILDQSNTNEIVDYVLLLLHKGVTSSTFKPTIQDSEIIQYYDIYNMNITINFSRDYYELAFDEEIYLRASVVKSLTSFDSISSVEFFVDGVPLKLEGTGSIGRQYSGDVLLSFEEITSRVNKQSVIMYFPNEDLSRLVGNQTILTITPNEKLEEIVVKKLLEEESNVMPLDVEVLNVYTHEGICFVDFSEEFQTSLLPKGISERIAIYALVNSLTELTNITNVQILVEGEIATTFQGTLSLNRIFTKNYSLIETDFGGE